MANPSNNDAGDEREPFPWHLGVFDAHCHPTDTMDSIASISEMQAKVLTVMTTRAEDQELVARTAKDLGVKVEDAELPPEQWKDRPPRIVPCFGWHPWFSHQMFDGDEYNGAEKLDDNQKVEHYRSVLIPPSEDHGFLTSLPDPRLFGDFLAQTRRFLEQHSLALVGEVGLDKSFRIPQAWLPESKESRDASLTPGGREGRRLSPYRVHMDHQRKVLKAQLRLAGELKRAVSVHSVQTPGIVYEVLQELWKGHEKQVLSKRERKRLQQDKARNAEEPDSAFQSGSQDAEPKPYPPRICLHSYSGPVEALQQFLAPSVPAEIYFSFSTAINFSSGPASKAEDTIRAVPDEFILVESDLHIAGHRMDQHLEDIVRLICRLKNWSLEDGVKTLGRNWKRFVFGRS
ncbi:Metallo-dependent hydrolase [Aulographum hederae CBS 113979]|uniref:Metallo-dependent hydrolase n=1 Tax=Aulographum hederae CBS 113979 TaxID=1176131 RepID=A0A6G1HGM2_9PEZI|nr:Metallo-dependent hydrolase [Aulographum hederae CBS 113979]